MATTICIVLLLAFTTAFAEELKPENKTAEVIKPEATDNSISTRSYPGDERIMRGGVSVGSFSGSGPGGHYAGISSGSSPYYPPPFYQPPSYFSNPYYPSYNPSYFPFPNYGFGGGYPYDMPNFFQAGMGAIQSNLANIQDKIQSQAQNAAKYPNFSGGFHNYPEDPSDYYGAGAFAGYGPHGGVGFAGLNPGKKFGTEFPKPGGAGSHGVFTSSSSGSSNINGKTTSYRSATTGVDDNGKVTTYTVRN